MAHSDDNGLVLPPKLAPFQVVIVPIYKNAEELKAVSQSAEEIIRALREKHISVKFDDSDANKPGWKFAEYELKGVPVRIAIGPRDLENGTVELARRDTLTKQVVSRKDIGDTVESLLEAIQKNLFDRAKANQQANITEVNTFDEFKDVIENKGGFVSAHWDGTAETEEKIKELTKATIRCIPENVKFVEGKCVLTGKPSKNRVLFARAY